MAKSLKVVSLILGILVAAVLMLYFFVVKNNFHTVVPQQIYRSAQPSAELLRHFIKTYHIRSIVNLRGSNPTRQWYRDEVRVSKKLGVKHYDIRMSAYHLPTMGTLRKLVETLQKAPEPLLIHCEGGSDRSGLAAAIFLILKGDSLQQAERQYSWEYLVYSKHSVGKLVIPIYIAWLRKHHLQNNRRHFLQWVAVKK